VEGRSGNRRGDRKTFLSGFGPPLLQDGEAKGRFTNQEAPAGGEKRTGKRVELENVQGEDTPERVEKARKGGRWPPVSQHMEKGWESKERPFNSRAKHGGKPRCPPFTKPSKGHRGKSKMGEALITCGKDEGGSHATGGMFLFWFIFATGGFSVGLGVKKGGHSQTKDRVVPERKRPKNKESEEGVRSLVTKTKGKGWGGGKGTES